MEVFVQMTVSDQSASLGQVPALCSRVFIAHETAGCSVLGDILLACVYMLLNHQNLWAKNTFFHSRAEIKLAKVCCHHVSMFCL